MHPAFFTLLYTFFLLLQDSRKTSDKRQETAFCYWKYTKRYRKANSGLSRLLGVIVIPIQHVVVVRAHGPILHRHPLNQTIRLKDQVPHFQSGAVATNLFLQVTEEDRGHRVDGLKLCRLWHNNGRKDGRIWELPGIQPP